MRLPAADLAAADRSYDPGPFAQEDIDAFSGFIPFLMVDCRYEFVLPMPGLKRYACLAPFAFTTAIVTGRVGDRGSTDDRWCYHDAASAKRALLAWTGRDFEGEPHLEIDEALEMVGLPDIGHLPFGFLSTGQKRRASIARLLVTYRPVWLLDEPTAGLDARSERQFAGLMAAHLEDGGLIMAATHVPLGIGGAREMVMGAAC